MATNANRRTQAAGRYCGAFAGGIGLRRWMEARGAFDPRRSRDKKAFGGPKSARHYIRGMASILYDVSHRSPA